MNKDTPDEIDEILQQFQVDVYEVVGDALAPKKETGSTERKKLLGSMIEVIPYFDEAKAKLNSLITAARINELERIPKLQSSVVPMNSLQTDFILDRIKELESTLTNDKIEGEHGDSK